MRAKPSHVEMPNSVESCPPLAKDRENDVRRGTEWNNVENNYRSTIACLFLLVSLLAATRAHIPCLDRSYDDGVNIFELVTGLAHARDGIRYRQTFFFCFCLSHDD